jgi:hypothetical protein
MVSALIIYFLFDNAKLSSPALLSSLLLRNPMGEHDAILPARVSLSLKKKIESSFEEREVRSYFVGHWLVAYPFKLKVDEISYYFNFILKTQNKSVGTKML